MRYLILVLIVHDFVAEEYECYVGRRVKRNHIGFNPVHRHRLCSGEGRDETVGYRYYEGDLCVGEGSDNIWVGVKKLHMVDVSLGLQEVCHHRRRRKIICQRSVVNADEGGMGEIEDQDGDAKE